MANDVEFEARHFGVGFISGADLSALRYHAVKINSSQEVIAVAAATDVVYGVLQNDPASGQETEVEDHGITKMAVGAGGVTAGLLSGLAVDGKAIALGIAGTTILGLCLQTAASGEFTSIQLNNHGPKVPA